MAMAPIPAFPALSDRADGTYNSKAFDWATHMANTFVPELNAVEGSISALAAGGAYAFPYIFDSATADADPGVGKLRLGSATQSAATVLRIDTAIVGGVDIAQVFTDLLAGTSATKGSIRLVKAGDPSKWMVFDVTGGSGSGYRNLVVSARAFSAASPFANGDSLIAYIERAGDKGLQGDSASYSFLGSAVVGTAVAQIDFLTAFAAGYEKIIVEILGVVPSATDTLRMRLASGGVVDVQPNYYQGAANTTMSGLTYWNIGNGATTAGGSFTVEIRNALSAGPKSISANGSVLGSINGGFSHQGYTALAAALSGLRLYWSNGATFTAGTVRIYGVRNS